MALAVSEQSLQSSSQELCVTEFALSLESQLGENKPEACIPDT